MKDIKMRGVVLQKYYDRRREGLVQLRPGDFNNKFTNDDICSISEQLNDHHLIEWISVGEIGAGMGKILAMGIDVIENGPQKSPIGIVLDKGEYNTSGSSNLRVGEGTVLKVTVPDTLRDPSVLKQLSSNQLIFSVMGLLVGTICIAGGFFLFGMGITGKINWTAKIWGTENQLVDAAPGVVLFIVGLFIIVFTKFDFTVTGRGRQKR